MGVCVYVNVQLEQWNGKNNKSLAHVFHIRSLVNNNEQKKSWEWEKEYQQQQQQQQ